MRKRNVTIKFSICRVLFSENGLLSLKIFSTLALNIFVSKRFLTELIYNWKKPWVTKDVLDLCDERRDLKKKRYEAEGAKEYREANRRFQKAVKKAKEDWIGAQCEEIETCLNKNNRQESISAGEGSNLRETG